MVSANRLRDFIIRKCVFVGAVTALMGPVGKIRLVVTLSRLSSACGALIALNCEINNAKLSVALLPQRLCF